MAEIASAYVQLIPSFKGGKNAIAGELEAPVIASGKKIATSFKQAFSGGLAGMKQATAPLRGALEQASKAQTKALTNLKTASEAAAKAKQSHEKATASLERAEQAQARSAERLSTATEKANAAARKAGAASAHLTGSRQKLEAATNAVQVAQNKLNASLSKPIRTTIFAGLTAAANKAGGAIRNAMKSLGSVATKGMQAFGGAVKIGAGAAGVLGTALAGLSLKGGFERAMNIGNAQAKLRGLGHSAQSVKGIIDNATEAVTGTAYGLGDAASVAAMLSAAGVKAGKEMTNSLKTVASVAAVSGRSMSDIGTIFGSIAARGKLQGDDMLQLMSSGIPVLQLLGTHLGKTSAEVSQMVSKGEIDFKTFQEAMEAGMGPAAAEMAKTFSGSLANVKAALSKVTEPFFTHFFEGMTKIFIALKPVIEQVTKALKPLAEAFGTWFTGKTEALANALEKLRGNLENIKMPTAFSNIGQTLAGLTPLIGAMAGALGPLLTNLPIIGQLFTGLTGPVGLVIGLVTSMVTTSAPLRQALAGAFQTIAKSAASLGPVFSSLMAVVGSFAGGLGDAIAPLISGVGQVVGELVGTLAPAAERFMPLLSKSVTVLMQAISELVAQALPPVIAAIEELFPVVEEIIRAVLPVVISLIKELVPVIAGLAPVIGLVLSLLPHVIKFIADILIPVIQAIVPTLQGVIAMVGAYIRIGVEYVKGLVNMVKAVISGDWNGAWQAAINTVGRILPLIGQFVAGFGKTLLGLVKGLAVALLANWGLTWDRVKSMVSTAWNYAVSAISAGVSRAIRLVSSLPGRIMSALSGLGYMLYRSGAAMIDGFSSGIRSAFSRAISAVANGISAIRAYFPFSPAKTGPFSGRGWVLYSGLAIGDAMAEGLSRSTANAQSKAELLASRIQESLRVNPVTQSAYNPYGINRGYGHTGTTSVNVTQNIQSNDPGLVSRMVARRIMGVADVAV